MRKFFLFLLTGAFLIGAFAFWHYQPAKVVKRKVEKVIALASFEHPEGLGGQASRTLRFEKLFADTITFSSDIEPLNQTFERQELVQYYQHYLNYVNFAEIEATEITVELTSPTTARARIVAPASISTQSGAAVNHLINGYLDFEKSESGWQISSGLLQDTNL